jgi:TolA-binding protein
MKGLIDRFAGARAVSLALVAAVLTASASAGWAQDASSETRLRKIEAEVRALQRTVFPGGDERFFKPEVTSGQAGGAGAAAPATTSAVTDILSRMDAIEAQLAQLTGQLEENTNRIGVLEARAGIVTPSPAALPAAGSTPPAAATSVAPATGVAAPASTAAPATTAASTPAPAVAASAPSPVAAPAAVTPAPVTAPATSTAAAATSPSASRLAAVRAIEKPQTGDPGDDEYSYGFRLWEAKFYPEARQQLKLFVDKYPRHRRMSWGRNLLGRSYLDDGQAAEAAKWFLENYQSDKAGARAPDSLLYLGVAMKALKDTKRACIALAEFSETYAAEAAGRLKGQYDGTRRGLTCPA